jgi:hypothetical protein
MRTCHGELRCLEWVRKGRPIHLGYENALSEAMMSWCGNDDTSQGARLVVAVAESEGRYPSALRRALGEVAHID